MFAFLAALVFLAAGEAPSLEIIKDDQVPQFLKPAETTEWNNAQEASQRGRTRVILGNSIMGVSRTAPGPVASGGKGATVGGLSETPDQVKARAQKIIDEGNASIAQALPSLNRLRFAASVRSAEFTKLINFSAELKQVAWAPAIASAVVGLQNQAKDAGFKEVHLLGAFAILADGKLQRPPGLLTELRTAWIKTGDKTLARVPEEGYSYVAALEAKGLPSVAKGLVAPNSMRQTALVWVELYSISAESTQALLFVRMADAYTMRVMASELALTGIDAASAPVATSTASIIFKDAKSFVPRLAGSGDWIFGFERESPPIAAAMVTHLVTRHSKIGTSASAYVVAAIGGEAPALDGARAKWKLESVKSEAREALFNITAIPIGATPLEVGQLTLRLEDPSRPATQR